MRGRTTIFLLATLMAAAPSLAQEAVRRVPLSAPSMDAKADKSAAKISKKGRGCVPVEAIAGAVVADDRTVELSLKDGSRWRMRFADACPALGYYQGFYYRRAQAKYLCAQHDAVIARSGGECPIDSLTRTKKAKKKKR